MCKTICYIYNCITRSKKYIKVIHLTITIQNDVGENKDSLK